MKEKIIATNRKAYHEFFILDKFEAGIELLGSEVKSLREGSGNLKEGYVVIRDGIAIRWVWGNLDSFDSVLIKDVFEIVCVLFITIDD